jgi:hypothetical protein
LSVILFAAGFIAEDPTADTVRADAERIHVAALRAADITRQLHALSEEQPTDGDPQ